MIKFDFSRAQQSAAVAITAAWEKISVTSNGNVPYDIIMTRPTRRDYKRRVRQDFFLPRVCVALCNEIGYFVHSDMI